MPSPLPFGLTDAALAAAMAEPDPGSLAAATRLRQTYGPDLAAAGAKPSALDVGADTSLPVSTILR